MIKKYADISNAKKKAQKIGFELVTHKEGFHKDEYIVLAYSEKDKEYVTWIYNAKYDGFFSGHYINHWYNITKDDALELAMNDFNKRR